MLYKEKVLHKQYLKQKFIPYRYKSRPCTTALVLLRLISHQHIHPIHCYFCYSLNRPSFCHFHSYIRLFLCRYHSCSSVISLLVNWCWENRQGQTLHNRPYGTVGRHTFISLTISWRHTFPSLSQAHRVGPSASYSSGQKALQKLYNTEVWVPTTANSLSYGVKETFSWINILKIIVIKRNNSNLSISSPWRRTSPGGFSRQLSALEYEA